MLGDAIAGEFQITVIVKDAGAASVGELVGAD